MGSRGRCGPSVAVGGLEGEAGVGGGVAGNGGANGGGKTRWREGCLGVLMEGTKIACSCGWELDMQYIA